jgi:biotin carboxylase
MNRSWIVFSTAGRWQTQGIINAKKMGLSVIAIDGDPDAEGFKFADQFICHELSDIAGIILKLSALKLNVKGVISYCSEAGMPLAAKIRESLNLKGLNSIETTSFTNKKKQRELWDRAKISGPNFRTFESPSLALTHILNSKLPLIIKPTDSAGSRGVCKIDENTKSLEDIIENAFEFSHSNEVIIEDYITGQELTVETFTVKGECYVLCITEKKKIKSTGGVVAYELHTTNHSENILANIIDKVKSALNALSYISGPAHTEVILEKNGDVTLVETAARGGGFNLFDRFIPAASGIDVSTLSISEAVSIELQPIILDSKHAILRFIPSRKGKIISITGIEQAFEKFDVECESFVEVGELVNDAITDGDRLAYMLGKGTDLASINHTINEAEALIEIKIE